MIPVCLTRAFGVMVRDTRQGHVLLAVMGVLWGGLLTVAWWAETHPNGPATLAAGAALEGKEVRFGIPSSVLFAVSTTGTSTGAVNSLHDSYTGLGGGVPLFNMLLGEVAPGGVGAGLYGILVLAVIAVFLAGLMVGRTPEYLGKKLGRVQVTAAAIAILAMPTVVLLGAAAALALPGQLATALANDGAHGLSEVLYAYASAGNNNGSAFAGLTVTSPFFQATLGLAMLVGRFVPILAVLALAGSLAAQKRVEPGRAPCPPPGRCSGCWSAAPSSWSPRSRSSPPSPWARSRRHWHEHPDPGPRRSLDRQHLHAERTGRAVAAGAFAPRQLWQALPPALRKLDPRTQARNPVMFVVWVGSVLVTGSAIADPSVFAWLIAVWLWITVLFANLAEAVAEDRGKAQADTPAADPHRHRRPPAAPRRDRGARARYRAADRRPRRRRGRRGHPRRRRHRRGHRHHRRVGDHRRVRPGDPRGRRGPLVGDRRHDGAVRPDPRGDHHQARGVVPRPDDRAGGGRAAAEDAQRDRADHPARRADDHLPARRRGAAADGRLLRRLSSRWWCSPRCWSA